MNQQMEQEIWRRVRAPGGPTAEEAVLPERLEALIVEQQAEAVELRAMARRLRGQGSATLMRIAAGIEARIRALTTLHYLLTGRRLRLQPPRPTVTGPLPETLRALTLRLRQTERAYAGLQGEFADYAEEFERFSRQTRSDGRAVTELLQAQLNTGR